MLIYCVFLTPIWYSFLRKLLKEGRLLYFLILIVYTVIPWVTAFVLIAPAAVHFVYKGIVNYFLEAWKDFTVEIESGGAPIEAAFESV